jgi:hypothetical protein
MSNHHENNCEDDKTVTHLHQEIERLQLEIQQVYSGELFNARVCIAYLEKDVKDLTAENEKLRIELSSYKTSDDDNDTPYEEEDGDWYTSHGHGD